MNSSDVIDLGIDLNDFEEQEAIGLEEARQLIVGRTKPVHAKTLRGWCNGRIGCRPQGKDGPKLLLPAVRIGGVWRTMPSWVQAFNEARVRLSVQATETLHQGQRTQRSATAAQRRAERQLDRLGVA